MSENILQVYQNNPITSNSPNDLFYIGQSPYGANNDAAIKYSDLAKQFASNSIASTAWVPLFTFTTPGDLSVSYAIQTATSITIGPLAFFTFLIQFTPTFSTSAGNAIIKGFPYTNAAASNNALFPIYTSSAVSWAPSINNVIGYITGNTTDINIAAYGSNTPSILLDTTNFATGSAVQIGGHGWITTV